VRLVLQIDVAVVQRPIARSQAVDPYAGYVLQEKPQNVSREVVGQDMDVIQERGHMLFAVYEDYPP
jgi:hypothetical protein